MAAAELESQRAEYERTEELADLDARVAWAQYVAAQATWEASGGTVTLARRAFEMAGIRFEAGVSTQLELSDSRLQLERAESNHAQAARDLQVSRIRVALLPVLPLAGSTPSMTTMPSATPIADQLSITGGVPGGVVGSPTSAQTSGTSP